MKTISSKARSHFIAGKWNVVLGTVGFVLLRVPKGLSCGLPSELHLGPNPGPSGKAAGLTLPQISTVQTGAD